VTAFQFPNPTALRQKKVRPGQKSLPVGQLALMVVEDCAQSFNQVRDPAHPSSEVAMFSFGPNKTASALGGAVVRIKSAEFRAVIARSPECSPTPDSQAPRHCSPRPGTKVSAWQELREIISAAGLE
jgi:hypothetical protein